MGNVLSKRKEKQHQKQNQHEKVPSNSSTPLQDEKEKVAEMSVTLDDLKDYLHLNKHLLMKDKNKFTAET